MAEKNTKLLTVNDIQYKILANFKINNKIERFECVDDDDNLLSFFQEKISYNKYNLKEGNCGIGYLEDGTEFYFDLEDYNNVKKYYWQITKNKYLIAYSFDLKKCILFHRLIMGCENTKYLIDHINHNTLDNRKSNLRIVTSSQNAMNSKLNVKNTSGVKGVSFDKSRNKWMAYIKINGKNKNLGRYDSFEKAVRIRKEAEEKYFGIYNYQIKEGDLYG